MIITGIGNKGGIGLTSFLANLYLKLKQKKSKVIFISLTDLIPNVLYHPSDTWQTIFKLTRKIPIWDKSKCFYCDLCEKSCQYGAITRYSDFYIIYSELCISCMVCIYQCKKNALSTEDKVIGNIENSSLNNDVHRTKLLHREILTSVHIKQIYEWLKQHFSPDTIIIIDTPSGFRELWTEFINLSDIIILMTQDLIMWETLYKSLAHDQADVILVVPDDQYNAFSEAGYSYALPIPFDEHISFEILNGKPITDEYYINQVNECIFKLNIDQE